MAKLLIEENVNTTQNFTVVEVTPKKRTYLIAKRALDITAALMGLILAALPMLVIAIIVKLESPGPVVFVHNRIGKNGSPLRLLKFRSMFADAEAMIDSFTPEQKAEWEENFKLEHDPRITRFGRFLRKSSLDELPQLINVLRGDLSLVGPRPVVQQELERYGENQAAFLSVTPGLTGYWQAYARSTCSYEQRMEMELLYTQKASFWWDIKIIFATVGAVIRAEGAQ